MTELARWDGFYVIVGSAAGALIGLQFVVLTLIAEKPIAGAEQAAAAFGSPTVVHFAAALFLAALAHVPWPAISIAAIFWGLLGFGGVVYEVIVVWRMRKQSAYEPVFEDWLFHCGLPFAAYAALAGAALAVSFHVRGALFGVGTAAILLLFIGIHNAWDSVSYHVLVNIPKKNTERRQDKSE